jgi:hypothetical protein
MLIQELAAVLISKQTKRQHGTNNRRIDNE